MSGFIQIEEGNFVERVLHSAAPVLLEFGAVWCKPCKSLEPILQTLAAEWGQRVTLAKLDVDECTEIAMNYGIMSVPTLILFVQGEARERLVGLKTAEKISSAIDPHLF
jgi:thioredoxin 1